MCTCITCAYIILLSQVYANCFAQTIRAYITPGHYFPKVADLPLSASIASLLRAFSGAAPISIISPLHLPSQELHLSQILLTSGSFLTTSSLTSGSQCFHSVQRPSLSRPTPLCQRLKSEFQMAAPRGPSVLYAPEISAL